LQFSFSMAQTAWLEFRIYVAQSGIQFQTWKAFNIWMHLLETNKKDWLSAWRLEHHGRM
jgi:hypothetical protein